MNSFYRYLFFLFLFFSSVGFSQEKINHTVVKGESVYSIAKKYQVKPSEILELNPKADEVLKLNTVLLIPNKNNKPETNNFVPVIHEVLAKETLFGLSKKYKISIEKIKESNPTIETEGLKLGAKITIPVSSNNVIAKLTTTKEELKPEDKPEPKDEMQPEVKVVTKPVIENKKEGEEINHQVLPKETKFGISKRYKISIEELEKLNPEIVASLPVGYTLVIKKGTKGTASKIVVPQVKEESTAETPTTIENTSVDDVVAPLSSENMSKAEFLIAKASENLGAPYRSGGISKNGFDCSGLMFSTFKNIEMTLPRSSPGMATAGLKINRNQAQKGDLIFFATMRKTGVSHVGMITEVLEDEIKFIHSATHSGVIISSTNEPYYAKRFVQVNRVLN